MSKLDYDVKLTKKGEAKKAAGILQQTIVNLDNVGFEKLPNDVQDEMDILYDKLNRMRIRLEALSK